MIIFSSICDNASQLDHWGAPVWWRMLLSGWFSRAVTSPDSALSALGVIKIDLGATLLYGERNKDVLVVGGLNLGLGLWYVNGIRP